MADQELVASLRTHAVPVDCTQDRTLFNQGDEPTGLYVLHNGSVTVTMDDPSGARVVTLPAQPNSLLGLPGLVGNNPYSMSAEAKKGAEVGFVDRDAFSTLMLTEPGLGMMILRVLAAEVRTARLAMVGKN